MSGRIASVDVGTPAPGFDEQWRCVTTEVRFHGFADLDPRPPEGGDGPDMRFVMSPSFSCFGHQWSLLIYPRGSIASADDGMVSIGIANVPGVVGGDEEDDHMVGFQFGWSIRNCNGKEVTQLPMNTAVRDDNLRGYSGFAKRSVVLRSLVNGALIVEVRIRKRFDPNEKPQPAPLFIPTNPSACAIIRQMFNDEKTSDVTIEVIGQDAKDNAAKKAKTSPVTFYAHRFLLDRCTTTLAELCAPSEGKGSDVIQITDVTPEIFTHLLKYVYGHDVPSEFVKEHAKELIYASDKYGVANLKITAESAYVFFGFDLDVENVMDYLLYADSKNLALLKEKVMDFIAENKVEVLEKVSFQDIPGGPTMFSDLLTAVARGEKKGGKSDEGDEDQFSTMRINDLRRKAQEKGLGIDGSREMLIAALKENA